MALFSEIDFVIKLHELFSEMDESIFKTLTYRDRQDFDTQQVG